MVGPDVARKPLAKQFCANSSLVHDPRRLRHGFPTTLSQGTRWPELVWGFCCQETFGGASAFFGVVASS